MKLYLTEAQLKLFIENTIEEVDADANQANTNPSEAQKKAGNYKMGHTNFGGFDITIENPKGSYRRGADPNGKEWSIQMKNHYGYFTDTKGKDGDQIDVFLGSNLDFVQVFVVDQYINGKFDESKVMLGFNSSEEAKQAYLNNYSKDWKGFKKITAVSKSFFKDWLYDGYKQRKPFFQYVDVKQNEFDSKK